MPERGLEVDELDAMDRILDGCGSDTMKKSEELWKRRCPNSGRRDTY